MNVSWPESLLNRLGLWKALQDTPGRAQIVVVSILITYFSLGKAGLPDLPRMLAAALLGLVLGLVGFDAGNFWDKRLFGPRYGLKGRWIHMETSPWHVFTPGADLKAVRDRAIEAQKGTGHSGDGIYKHCLELAKASGKAQWAEIYNPLLLSKFIRSLIWPCMLCGLALIGLGVWRLIADSKHADAIPLMAGVALLVLAFLVLIPYFNLRVEHMMRLYDFASRPTKPRVRKDGRAREEAPTQNLTGSQKKASAGSPKKKDAGEVPSGS